MRIQKYFVVFNIINLHSLSVEYLDVPWNLPSSSSPSNSLFNPSFITIIYSLESPPAVITKYNFFALAEFG